MSDSCNPIDSSLPGSSVHGILQARILEWVAISSSRESSQPRNRTQSPAFRQIIYQLSYKKERKKKKLKSLSCVRLFGTPWTAAYQAPTSMEFSRQEYWNRLPFPSSPGPSVQFSRSVVSDSLRPHGSEHTRPPCPSPSPGVHSNSRPLSQ